MAGCSQRDSAQLTSCGSTESREPCQGRHFSIYKASSTAFPVLQPRLFKRAFPVPPGTGSDLDLPPRTRAVDDFTRLVLELQGCGWAM